MASFEGKVIDQGGEVINITNPAFGAKGDTVRATQGGSIVAGSTTFTQSGSTFESSDVGKVVTVQGAGLSGAVLTTKISTVVSATTVELVHPALTTVTDAGFTYGTDDTLAIAAAIRAARSFGTVYAPAGVYTILGSTWNTVADSNGGNQIHFDTRGGLVGDGGTFDPTDPASRPATIFLCADANAGILAIGIARYEGFLCDGNNIATAPLQNGILTGPNAVGGTGGVSTPTGGVPTGIPTGTATGFAVCYSTFIDVWATRSAGDGLTIYGSQNNTYYDCGSTDNARDGVYLDSGAGGLDFFHFYERGNLRYGVHGDVLVPAAGGFMVVTGDIKFYGGTFDTHPTRKGLSKVRVRGGFNWELHDVTIVGDNLDGPTIDIDQSHPSSYCHIVNGCRIWATPKHTSPGNACIQISGVNALNNHLTAVATDGCSFEAGDSSVYIADNNQYASYSAIGWTSDATTNGPVAVGLLPVDVGVQHATLPEADVLLDGRTGSWRQASVAAPWTGTVLYRVMAEGWVQMKGSVQSPTGTAGRIFTLPLGYRPPNGPARRLPVAFTDAAGTTAGVGELSIVGGQAVNPGDVTFAAVPGAGTLGIGSRVHLDGVRFPVRGDPGPNW